eukprot:scaffold38707_cov40-Attheya_sp.AAC.2
MVGVTVGSAVTGWTSSVVPAGAAIGDSYRVSLANANRKKYLGNGAKIRVTPFLTPNPDGCAHQALKLKLSKLPVRH